MQFDESYFFHRHRVEREQATPKNIAMNLLESRRSMDESVANKNRPSFFPGFNEVTQSPHCLPLD
jgi:hypothetical protein